jgi:hypothetical protein
LGIQISIEDALTTPELQLKAISFANLERGTPKIADQFIGREAYQLARLGRGRRRRHGLWCRLLLLRRSGTSGYEEDEEKG